MGVWEHALQEKFRFAFGVLSDYPPLENSIFVCFNLNLNNTLT